MSFSYNQIVSKVEELGLDPYYDMDSLPEPDRDDILDHLFLACDAADNLDAALFTFMDGSDAARMIVSLAKRPGACRSDAPGGNSLQVKRPDFDLSGTTGIAPVAL